MSPSLVADTFYLTVIVFFSQWFWPLLFPLALLILLFSLFPLPNCSGLSDVVLTGGFWIVTHNCVLCSLKAVISSPPQPVPIWSGLPPQAYPHPHSQPYSLQSSYTYHIESHDLFWSPWKRWSFKCFWTSPMLSMWGCSHWTTMNTPSNKVT